MKKKLLKISLIGKTNAGKSTLINNLIGEKISIINKKINTTEDLILGIKNIKNNQLIFYDTPGISFDKNFYFNKNKLKKNLWEGLNNSNLILYIIDSYRFNFDETLINLIKLQELQKKICIVLNKNDLIKKDKLLPQLSKIQNQINIDSFFNISAKKKLGIDQIFQYLLKHTYYSDWEFNNDEITDKNDIFITNECTRNAILTQLHKEIPYNIKISNEIFKYLKNGDLKIKQNIYISNSRYKKIILGKRGLKIKEIRTKSQKEIKTIFNTNIHLYINILSYNAKKN